MSIGTKEQRNKGTNEKRKKKKKKKKTREKKTKRKTKRKEKKRKDARSINPKVDHVSVRGTQEKTTLNETIISWMVCNILFMSWEKDGYQR